MVRKKESQLTHNTMFGIDLEFICLFFYTTGSGTRMEKDIRKFNNSISKERETIEMDLDSSTIEL